MYISGEYDGKNEGKGFFSLIYLTPWFLQKYKSRLRDEMKIIGAGQTSAKIGNIQLSASFRPSLCQNTNTHFDTPEFSTMCSISSWILTAHQSLCTIRMVCLIPMETISGFAKMWGWQIKVMTKKAFQLCIFYHNEK